MVYRFILHAKPDLMGHSGWFPIQSITNTPGPGKRGRSMANSRYDIHQYPGPVPCCALFWGFIGSLLFACINITINNIYIYICVYMYIWIVQLLYNIDLYMQLHCYSLSLTHSLFILCSHVSQSFSRLWTWVWLNKKRIALVLGVVKPPTKWS